MYKDKEKQQEAQRERTRRYRERQKGVTEQGVTSEGVTDLPGVLLDPIKREKLYRICQAFKDSHHPEYAQCVWLGQYSLSAFTSMFGL